MSDKNKKLRLGQMMWLLVAGVGNLLILVAVVSSLVGVSTPHPTDPVQSYDCGSVLAPKSSLSDSKLSTDIVCKDAMGGRRGSVFWMQVFGLVLSMGGMVMLVRPHFRRPKEKAVDE